MTKHMQHKQTNTAHFSASQWLSYIEALHPKAIAMGLERVREVALRLDLEPNFPIITVAGTNGKGSTCAMLNAIYIQASYQVGCYTSPHLIDYNERVRVNNKNISDADLCKAFAAVENARNEVALTYFEMGTLAAMWHFCQSSLDIVILEVGLGGRLDAVNVFEPTCAIVTSIDLDHTEYLGDTREKIALEKAGIYRQNKLAICGDTNPPQTLIDYAHKIGADLQLINRDFKRIINAGTWQYYDDSFSMELPKLAMTGDFQLNNAACAIRAVQSLQKLLQVSQACIKQALQNVQSMGRFYQIHFNPTIIVDVAHNPHAAMSLAHNLAHTPCTGNTHGVFAMLADKDIAGVVRAVLPQIHSWHVASISNTRGAKVDALVSILSKSIQKKDIHTYTDVTSSLYGACKMVGNNDRIIVFGSFYTVADAIVAVVQDDTNLQLKTYTT